MKFIISILIQKNNDLIINSLEKPVFKDKFRIRSYNKSTLEDNIFFEMKTKYKGIVVVTLLTIESGTFNLNTYDDSLHSNGNITINFGEYYISSGDDGIHADDTLTINNGTIEVTKTYEGLEAETIVINAGTINLVASDDGINAAGRADSSANNHPNHQETYSKSSLTINGGTITVNATGDGLDSNGNIYVNGGIIIVSGQQVMVMEP